MDGHFSNVFSNMNVGADLMVVGQNPGSDEVIREEPFVGASGQFFDSAVLEVLGLERASFYISNVVRCFTPGNRTPSADEMENCRDFLDREIALVKPKVVIALGAPSFSQLTGMRGITKHHGDLIVSARYGVHVVPIFHPSPRNMNDTERRRMFYEGLKTVREFLDAV